MTYYIYRDNENFDWSMNAYTLCFNYCDNRYSAIATNITHPIKHLPWGYDRYSSSATINMLVDNQHAQHKSDYRSLQAQQDYDFTETIHHFMHNESVNDFFDYIFTLQLYGKGFSARLDVTRFIENPLLIHLVKDIIIPDEYLYIEPRSGNKYITAENCMAFWDSILGPSCAINNDEEISLIIGG